ncbi:MAG: hypothetical protein ACXWZP_00440 [Gaiellaceae bacterium]
MDSTVLALLAIHKYGLPYSDDGQPHRAALRERRPDQVDPVRGGGGDERPLLLGRGRP